MWEFIQGWFIARLLEAGEALFWWLWEALRSRRGNSDVPGETQPRDSALALAAEGLSPAQQTIADIHSEIQEIRKETQR